MIELLAFILQNVQSFVNLALNNDIGRMFLALIIIGGAVSVTKVIKNLLFNTSNGN